MTFVLLHGFTGSSKSYDAVVAALGGTPLVPPLLGHGASATNGVRSFGDEVARLAQSFPAEPVALAGYSLGARLALAVTLMYPERVRSLTLISGQPGLSSVAERDERRRSDARWCELLEAKGIEAFVTAWEAQPLFLSQGRLSAELRASRRAERLEHDPLELARSLRVTGLGAMPDLGPRLGSIRAKVTLLAGELDLKFVALARAMNAAVPGSRLVIVPNSGHDLLLEAPDLVARELGEDARGLSSNARTAQRS